MNKYVTKTADVSVEMLVDFYLAMKGRQTTQRYEQLRGILKTEKQMFQPEPCTNCGCLVFDVGFLPYIDQQSHASGLC
jgi:hypothetical protein